MIIKPMSYSYIALPDSYFSSLKYFYSSYSKSLEIDGRLCLNLDLSEKAQNKGKSILYRNLTRGSTFNTPFRIMRLLCRSKRIKSFSLHCREKSLEENCTLHILCVSQ